MRAKRQRRSLIRLLAITYCEYQRVIRDPESEEDLVLACTAAYLDVSDQYRSLKLTMDGLDTIPDIGIFITKEGAFNRFMFHTLSQLLRYGGVPLLERSGLAEILNFGIEIRHYLLQKERNKE